MKRRFVHGVMLVVMLLVPAYAARYALLVGSVRGGPDNVPLKFVVNDLERMQSVLVDACGFNASDVVSLREPTPESVRRAFDDVRGRLARSAGDDLFLFYYTGHADGGAVRLDERRLRFDELWKELVACPARIKVAVFDACQSGSFARMKGGKLAEPFLFASDAKVEGVVVLSSSSANENSQESDALRSSVFTFHVVNALRGSADASGDGRITLNEAYQYAYHRTVTSTMHSSGGVQHPGYRFEIKGEGDVVLADLNLRAGGIMLSADVGGKIMVVDANRTVVADLSKERGSPMMIAVGAGAYEVIARRQDTTLIAACKVGKSGITTVEHHDFAPSRTKAETTRGKGRGGSDSYVGLTLGGGYLYASQEVLNEAFETECAGFEALGMHVRPEVAPHVVRGGVGAEWWIAGRVLLGLEMNYGSGTVTTGAQDSWVLNPHDSVRYRYETAWRTRLELFSLTPAIGFRLVRGPLRNLGFRLALDIVHAECEVSVDFRDGLYDVRNSELTEDGGALFVPAIAVSYTYGVRQWLDIGVAGRYRYQRTARSLKNGLLGDAKYIESLKYDLGGFDVRLYVSFNLGKDGTR